MKGTMVATTKGERKIAATTKNVSGVSGGRVETGKEAVGNSRRVVHRLASQMTPLAGTVAVKTGEIETEIGTTLNRELQVAYAGHALIPVLYLARRF